MCAGAEQAALGTDFLGAAAQAAALLNQRLEKLESENEVFRARAALLEEEVSALRKKLEAKGAEKAQADGGAMERLASIVERNVEWLEAENSALRAKVATLETTEVVKAEVCALEERLDTKIGTCQEAANGLEVEIGSLKEKMETVLEKVEAMKAAVGARAEAVGAKIGDLQARVEVVEAAAASITSLEEDMSALKEKVKDETAAFRKEVELGDKALKAEVCALRERLDVKIDTCQEAARILDLELEIGSLKEKMEAILEKVDAVQVTVDAQAEAAGAKIGDLQRSVETTAAGMRWLEEDMAALTHKAQVESAALRKEVARKVG